MPLELVDHRVHAFLLGAVVDDDQLGAQGAGRLSSAAGEGRYQLWSSAAQENASKPLTGTGSGTFEFWWARNGNIRSVVLDTHSLYMQTLGELGIVGLALLAAFFAAILIGGARATLRAASRARPQLAAALAGCTAFCLAASFDWIWQIPVLPVAMLLLASALVGAEARSRAAARPALRFPLRAALAVAAVGAVIAIAIPLSSSALVRQSQADARAANLPAALRAARSAQNVEPDAASPRLQQALLLETQGNLAPAAAAARAATRREPTNWQTWLVLSRVEGEQGRASASLHAYRKAKSLNPHSPLFAG